MSEYVFESNYTVYYKTPSPVPLKSIIDSLQGLEKLIETTPRVLKKLTGINNLGLRLEVSEIKSGSLIEKIILSISLILKKASMSFWQR